MLFSFKHHSTATVDRELAAFRAGVTAGDSVEPAD